MRVGEGLRWAREILQGGGDADGVASADAALVDAEVLLGKACGKTRAGLMADAEARVSVEDAARFRGWVERRAGGEPVAYIVGEKEFWSLLLRVTPEVLIPRAESELLVERALVVARGWAGGGLRNGLRILELGTGSGAIALALARELPQARIVATDVCARALAVAEGNRRRVVGIGGMGEMGGLEKGGGELAEIKFLQGDWFDALGGDAVSDSGKSLAGEFHIIVANPPYVAERDAQYAREFGGLRFEPRVALLAGEDGLAALRVIIGGARGFLCEGGVLMVEHGYQQAAAVDALFAENGFGEIAMYRDLAGHPRVTAGRK